MYVADKIGEDFKSWESGSIVVITAPTGTGKTSFILKALLPFAKSQGKSILYLVNRIALKKQLEDEVRADYTDFSDCITIFSYQEFVEKAVEDYSRHYYWVLDEAHYFLSDSSFNHTIERCMRIVGGSKKDHPLIFLSATPTYLYMALSKIVLKNVHIEYPEISCPSVLGKENTPHFFKSCRELLGYTETKKYRVHLKNKQLSCKNVTSIRSDYDKYFFIDTFHEYKSALSHVAKRCLCYTLPRDFSKFVPFYYINEDEIVEKVLHTNESEKWLIFVRTKEQGEVYKDLLLDKGIKTTFITQSSKRRSQKTNERKEYEQIISEKSFSCRVLISTMVLDNGISIKDPNLQHIVIEAIDETIFLQMLGRKRFTASDPSASLYLKDVSLGKMSIMFDRQILNIIKFFSSFESEKSWGETPPTGVPDNFTSVSFPSSRKPFFTPYFQQYMQAGKFKSPYSNYLTGSDFTRGYEPSADKKLKENAKVILDIYDIMPLPRMKMEYQFYKELAWMQNALNNPDKEYPWLREQLSWIDAEYDKTQWINYPEQVQYRKALEAMLETHLDWHMRTEIKEDFQTLVHNYAVSLRPPHPVFKTKKSLKKINEALRDWNLAYKVTSKNKYLNSKQGTYWKIVRAEE